MADATAEFFEGLAAHGVEPALRGTNGTLRVDLDRDGRIEHWWVAIRRGVVSISRTDAAADCVVRAKARVFDDLVSGRANAMAATLRNEIVIDGNPAGIVRLQRLFPAPTGHRVAASARTIGKRRG
jgi:putative sterol carrier protein